MLEVCLGVPGEGGWELIKYGHAGHHYECDRTGRSPFPKGVCALDRESVAMVILSGKKDLVGVIKDPGTERPARVIWVGPM